MFTFDSNSNVNASRLLDRDPSICACITANSRPLPAQTDYLISRSISAHMHAYACACICMRMRMYFSTS